MRNPFVLFLIAVLLMGSEVQPGPGGVISVKATAPIAVTSSRSPTVSYLPCGSANQFYVWNGTAWVCQTVPSSVVESDPIFAASVAHAIDALDVFNWNTAYGWGNHAGAGYLMSSSVNNLARATLTPTNGQTPVYNGDAGVWTTGAAAGVEVDPISVHLTGNQTLGTYLAPSGISDVSTWQKSIRDWNLAIGCLRAGSGTSLVCTTKRIKVEYKP